ncbi:MAG: Rieske (2Fe-2S) protein [Myxococcales bacterium]|nr:MAG: Rieske (2Fe-2S) protein [Myxococcales bacterium]
MSTTRVGVYRREVRADLPRVWENVYDWEHLPWLHHAAFSQIELVDQGSWGWRARVGLAPKQQGQVILLELRTEREAGRYVARTLEGPGAGTEIWTRLEARGAHTGIEVAFCVPGVASQHVAGVGAAFERLYARLWDEDEAMMQRRTQELSRLDRAAAPALRVALGPQAPLLERLPLVLEVGGEKVRLVRIGDEIVAHSARCPHWLGPLEDASIEDGCVRCPWHGYRFDVRTGASADGRHLRLSPAPRVEIDAEGGVALVRP